MATFPRMHRVPYDVLGIGLLLTLLSVGVESLFLGIPVTIDYFLTEFFKSTAFVFLFVLVFGYFVVLVINAQEKLQRYKLVVPIPAVIVMMQHGGGVEWILRRFDAPFKYIYLATIFIVLLLSFLLILEVFLRYRLRRLKEKLDKGS